MTEAKKLADSPIDLLVFPEYANCPGLTNAEALWGFVEGPGRQFLEHIKQITAEIGCITVVNTAWKNAELRVNRTWVLDRQGDVLGHYDKCHLTSVESGELGLCPGDGIDIVEAEGLKIGFATCFDVYFPEHFETLASARPDLVISSSYQRSESAERLRMLSSVRALDVGAWLLRASYAMGPRASGGHTLIAAPDGRITADIGNSAGVLIGNVDPAYRFTKPASHGQPDIEHRELLEAHRRSDLYRGARGRAEAVSSAPFPRICAHRGLSEACPENTLPAFAAALSLPGVHEIELDVWMSLDGVPVVCHDPQVDRTTDGEGIVTELPWETIRSFDAGISYGEQWRGIPIPRLEEVLDLVNHRAYVNIHIKAPGPDGNLVANVAGLLRERGLTRLGYIAGEEDVLEAARDVAPDVARACLAHQSDPPLLITTAVNYGCTRLQFFRNVEQKHADQAKEAGLIRNLFWSDEVQDARSYARLGIDVILTNRAHQLAGNI